MKYSCRVLSIMPKQTVRKHWNYQEKMERHCLIETKFPIELKRSICVLIKNLITVLQSRTGNQHVGNGMTSFGRTVLSKGTTSGGEPL